MRLKAIVALALGMLVAAGASAQTMRQGEKLDNATKQTGTRVGGMSASDSIAWLLPFDTSGNLKVTQSVPIQEAYRAGTASVFSKVVQYASAESSEVIDTHDLRLMGLMVKSTVPDSIASPFVRLAIQIRAHFNTSADTAHVFPWRRPAFGAAGQDTLAAQQGVSTVTAADFSSEFVVTLKQGNAAAGAFPGAASAYLMLSDWGATEFWAPYTSIRVRFIAGGAKATTKAPTVTINLVGTPL